MLWRSSYVCEYDSYKPLKAAGSRMAGGCSDGSHVLYDYHHGSSTLQNRGAKGESHENFQEQG